MRAACNCVLFKDHVDLHSEENLRKLLISSSGESQENFSSNLFIFDSIKLKCDLTDAASVFKLTVFCASLLISCGMS